LVVFLKWCCVCHTMAQCERKTASPTKEDPSSTAGNNSSYEPKNLPVDCNTDNTSLSGKNSFFCCQYQDTYLQAISKHIWIFKYIFSFCFNNAFRENFSADLKSLRIPYLS
jgi:hypothetical protein